jgi:hypothetical protein
MCDDRTIDVLASTVLGPLDYSGKQATADTINGQEMDGITLGQLIAGGL